jgi:glycosyltransferase involved in cell wall biosynthesis
MLVSVVIPVHNAARYLAECLDSVLAQDYAPLEIIAVDNGSQDASLDILKQYAARGVRVLTESKPGAAAARNAGVRAARGELIAFQDADDIWAPGKLSAQVRYLREHPQIGIVFGQFANWYPDEHGRFEPPQRLFDDPARWEVKEELSGWIYVEELLSCPIAMIVPLLRREVMDVTGGFDESMEAGSDYEFWLRATYRFQAHKLPLCLALYRHHGRGITSRVRMRSTIALALDRAMHSMGLTGPDGRSVSERAIHDRFAEIWFQFGILHLQRGSIRVGLDSLRKYFRFERSVSQAVLTTARIAPATVRERLRTTLAALRAPAAQSFSSMK